MTLDEAILHVEEVAGSCERGNPKKRSKSKCASEHRQLAEWLKELKALKAEPCEDAISRDDAIMCMTGMYIADLEYKPDDIISQHIKRIKALPSVTPKQKTGKWIEIKNRNGSVIALRCSECSKSPKYAIRSDYCPCCGIKMEGETKE